MPLLRARRPLKRWRYVGVYSAELMLCAGQGHVAGLPQRWWAVALPDGTLLERTTLSRGGLELGPSRIRVEARAARTGTPVSIDLELGDTPPVEVVSPHGRSYIWTAKRAAVPVRGQVRVGHPAAGHRPEEHRPEEHGPAGHGPGGQERLGQPPEGQRPAGQPPDGQPPDGPTPGAPAPQLFSFTGEHGFVDESAGYHARHTAWRWSAGIGRSGDGRAVAWNLVDGVHDAPEVSERTVWIDGEPHQVAAQPFAADLSRVGELSFERWSAREHSMSLGVVRSRYVQPFGSFHGTLPGGVELASGYGVMEDHEVAW